MLAGRDTGGGQSGNAHGHAAPAGDGGKFGGALHGFADVAKMVGGASVNGDGTRMTERRGPRSAMSSMVKSREIAVKYFIAQRGEGWI